MQMAVSNFNVETTKLRYHCSSIMHIALLLANAQERKDATLSCPHASKLRMITFSTKILMLKNLSITQVHSSLPTVC